MATQAANSISAVRAGARWSLPRTNGNAAGVVEILGAPDRTKSHFVKSLLVVGGSTGDGFQFLRRAHPLLGAAAQNITITDAATLQMATGDFSVELWFRWVSGTVAAVPGLLAKGGATEGYLLELTAAGLPKFTFGDSDESKAVTGTINVADGKWHHICAVVDRGTGPANTVYLYVDGKLNTSATDATVEGNTNANATDVTLTGVDNVSFGVCGVGIYKGLALAAATVLARVAPIGNQIRNEVTAPAPGSGVKFTGGETSLQCGLNMDEGTGTAFYDATGTHTVAGTGNTWETEDGLPLGLRPLPNTILIPATGTTLDIAFDPPLEIGNGNPLRTLETDGSFTVQINGETR